MTTPFGCQFRKEHFYGFFNNVTNLNHGAYGATTPALLEAKAKHSLEIQGFPDEFFRYGLFDHSLKARRLVAELVNAHLNNIVLVANATTAANTVLRSFPFQHGDAVVCFSTVYGACLNTLRFLERSVGIQLTVIDIVYPISNDEILKRFKHTIFSLKKENDKRTIMAFVDAVSSTPAALLPWQDVVSHCRKQNVVSFVDAAHYIGLLPLDLHDTESSPDFLTSNLHKWFFLPNSAALLYVAPQYHSKVHSLPISATYLPDNNANNDINASNLVSTQFSGNSVNAGDTTLARQFAYVSTLDYSAILTIPDAFAFRQNQCGGEDKIINYNLSLAKQAAEYIVSNWTGSELLTSGNDKDDIITAMFNVKVPYHSISDGYSYDDLVIKGTFVNDYLRLKKRTYIPVYIYNNSLWTRWCAQVYLELEDFKWGLKVMKEAFGSWEKRKEIRL